MFILDYNERRVVTSSSLNFATFVRVNWDYAVIYSGHPQEETELRFAVITYNDYCKSAVDIAIQRSDRSGPVGVADRLRRYYLVEMVMSVGVLFISLFYFLGRRYG